MYDKNSTTKQLNVVFSSIDGESSKAYEAIYNKIILLITRAINSVALLSCRTAYFDIHMKIFFFNIFFNNVNNCHIS